MKALLKKTITAFLFFFLLFNISLSQNLDSIYNAALNYARNSDFEVAKIAFQELLENAIVQKKENYILLAYQSLGAVEFELNNQEKGLSFYKKAIHLADENEDYLACIRMNNWVSRNFRTKNKYFSSLDYALKGLEYSKILPENHNAMYLSLKNVGQSYYNLYMPDSASFYYNLASVEIDSLVSDKNYQTNKEILEFEIANVHLMNGKYHAALKIFKNQIGAGDDIGLFYNISACYLRLHHLDSAEKYANLYYKKSRQSDNETTKPDSYSLLSKLYFAKKDYKKALGNTRLGINAATELNMPEYLAMTYLDLAKAFLGLGRIDSSDHYFDKYEKQIAATYRDDLMGMYRSAEDKNINDHPRIEKVKNIQAPIPRESANSPLAAGIGILAFLAYTIFTIFSFYYKKSSLKTF